MITKLVDLFVGKVAEVAIGTITVVIEKSILTAMEKIEQGRIAKVEKEMNRIEAELNAKPRITDEEAMDYARRINDARRKL